MGLRLADDVLTRGFERIQREIDVAFDALLPIPDDARARLVEAMRYAAIAGGEAGVQRAITLLKAEIDRDLALLGIRSISEITPDLVRKF